MRWLVLLLITACAHRPVGDLRFRNQPPVWRVDDRRPLAKAPVERRYNRTLYHADGLFIRKLLRAMEMRSPHRARDINSLDEVPDSSWFTNRIGVRDLSIAEVRRGPNTGPDPFAHLPWTIVKSKPGGLALGFQIEDAAGNRHLLKFDDARFPEMEIAAHVIVHRILWACGYNVPEDHVGYVDRQDLVIGAAARARGLTDAILDAKLATTDHSPDGRIRVLVSRWLPGTPIGPYAREGTREDDPNDVIPHELRRSLRGQYAVFSWLDHTDIQEDNTLDVFVDGHVQHYLIDFGKALGVMGHTLGWKTVGHTYRLDLGIAFTTLLGLGLWQRPWDERESTGLVGVGLYDAASFDPGHWRPNSMYWPLEDRDRFDAFWGAKIAIRFTRAQLAAIVDEAQLSDPRAAAYLVDTLVARQRTLARFWFDRVAPLDGFSIAGDRLCFSDLALGYGLTRAATTYQIEIYDRDGRATGDRRTLRAVSPQSCTSGVTVDGYTMARVVVRRGARALPPVVVHLAPDRARRPAVIGLRRY
jgi:hypothetical protein